MSRRRKYVSKRQAARELGCSTHTLGKGVNAGEIRQRPQKPGGTRMLVHIDDCTAWVGTRRPARHEQATDITYEEAAGLLGMSVTSVRQYVSRGRFALSRASVEEYRSRAEIGLGHLSEGDESYEGAKAAQARKLRAQADHEESKAALASIKLQEAEGDICRVSELRAAGSRIAVAVSAFRRQLQTRVPIAMARHLDTHIRDRAIVAELEAAMRGVLVEESQTLVDELVAAVRDIEGTPALQRQAQDLVAYWSREDA